MKKLILIFSILLLPSSLAFSHCQIPCGIYDDEARLDMIAEDILTVEKSMNQIIHLSEEKKKNYNQIVRWVNNKDEHADKISNTVMYYFMAQRVAPASTENEEEQGLYFRKIALLHELIFYSMKAKQTTDLSYVEKMRAALKEFRKLYSEKGRS